MLSNTQEEAGNSWVQRGSSRTSGSKQLQKYIKWTLHFFQADGQLEPFLLVKTISGWISLWFLNWMNTKALTVNQMHTKHISYPARLLLMINKIYNKNNSMSNKSVPRSAQIHNIELSGPLFCQNEVWFLKENLVGE